MPDKPPSEEHRFSPAELSEEEHLFKQTVASFAKDTIAPHVRRMDEDGVFDSEIISNFFQLGLMGIEIPSSLGGAGSSFFMTILAVEELSRVDASAGVIVDVQNTLVNNAILRWGSEEQKKHYLPLLASEWVGAYALSEADSGSDAFSLSTRAESRNHLFILNGRKMWTTNGSEASLFVVFANAAPEKGYKGITAFLVERAFPGFSVGKKEDKLGIRASSTCELILENCEVPQSNVLGEVGKGYKVAIETLNEGRIGIGAQMIGLTAGALEYAIDYSKERHAFGKPIASFQGIQFPLADMATELEAARLLVYNAARRKDRGEGFVKEAAMAKYFSSVVAEKVTSQAIEIYGGYGYTKDYPVEKYFRDAKIGTIYEGTSNMQLATIAKVLTADS
ncbi:acyl-CoA dehydrogenase [Acidobacteria bacterium AH-259-D05]|nr:acyl-CoA dehydrogenase [Acidobacteria bacterium AH-259-D05]